MTHTVHAKLPFILLAALALPIPATGTAQSLGEIARQYRKEREARKKKGEVPFRVFTNDDVARMPPIAILESSRQETTATEPGPPASSQSPEAAGALAQAGQAAAQPGEAEDRAKSKVFWQGRFKTARTALARAKEEQTLVEDELHLLQIQQARELDPDRSRKLNGKIDATTVEVQAKRAATEKAQAAMDEIEKEFKKSGAPREWIQDDT